MSLCVFVCEVQAFNLDAPAQLAYLLVLAAGKRALHEALRQCVIAYDCQQAGNSYERVQPLSINLNLEIAVERRWSLVAHLVTYILD